MNKARVRLWEHVGTGIIIAYPSGVLFSNMTCGHADVELGLEGIFVPVGNDTTADGKLISPQNRLIEYFRGPPHYGAGAVTGLTQADADVVDAALHENLGLRHVTVDRDRLHESFEGWVWLMIQEPSSRFPLFEGIGSFPLWGILTWDNVA